MSRQTEHDPDPTMTTAGEQLLDPRQRTNQKKGSRPMRANYATRRAFTAAENQKKKAKEKAERELAKQAKAAAKKKAEKAVKAKKAAKKMSDAKPNFRPPYQPTPPNFSTHPTKEANPFLSELAKRHLFEFIEATKPGYDGQWFHRLIAQKVEDCITGKGKSRLMVFVPPQHGKSEITSRKAPAWIIGRDPSTKVVLASYSATLAEGFNRDVQRTIESDEYKAIFPKVKTGGSLVQKNEMFETSMGGFVKAVGVGTALTGTAVDVGFLDDPVKDKEEAYSEVFREKVWNWWMNVFETRLHNDSKVILIMTRWHHDDIAGRLLDEQTGRPDDWDVVVIPALKETPPSEDDKREIGEPLWPARHSLQKLLDTKAQSERTFSSLYQQSPENIGGNIVKREWFGVISRQDFMRMEGKRAPVFFLDTAYTEKTYNDPTGIMATTFVDGNIYIFKAQKRFLEFPQLNKYIIEFCRSNGYVTGSSIRIEPKASGISVLQQIKSDTMLNVIGTPTPKEDKTTRLNIVAPVVEGGRIWLVDEPWNVEFLAEVCGFPSAKHDEYVDLLCYAVDHWITRRFKPAKMKLGRHQSA